MKNFTRAFFTAIDYNWLYKDTLLTIKRGLENGTGKQEYFKRLKKKGEIKNDNAVLYTKSCEKLERKESGTRLLYTV